MEEGQAVETPAAQEPVTAADSAVQPVGQVVEGDVPGVQVRIDELTHARRTAERLATTLQEQNTKLMELLATRERVAVAPEAPPEIDPEDQKKMAWFIKQAVAPLQEKLDVLNGQLAQQRVARGPEVFQKVKDPKVRARAEELAEAWEKQGHIAKGIITVDDAVIYAAGEAALAAQRGNAARAAHNDAAPVPLSGQNGGAGHVVPRAPVQTGEVNYNDMTIEQIRALRESTLKGAGR